MNIGIHVVSGAIGVLAVARVFSVIDTALFFVCASFLDVDHYLVFALRKNSLNLKKAVAYFQEHKHTPRFCFCFLHSVELLVALGLLALFFKSSLLFACCLGCALHHTLDFIQALWYRRLHYRWWSLVGFLNRGRQR